MIQLSPIRVAFVAIALFISSLLGAKAQSPASNPQAAVPPGSMDHVPNGVTNSDWTSIRAAYEAGRHAAYAVDGGFSARSHGQRWNTQFDGRGFLITPDDSGWTWGLELQSYGWGSETRTVSAAEAMNSAGQTVEYRWDSNLTEWYKNESRGLEHGYTIHRRPSDAHGTLTIQLGVRGDLKPQVQANGRDVRFVSDAGAVWLNYSGLSVVDVNGVSLPAKFEATASGLELNINDLGAQYPITIDPVVQQAYLKASGLSSHFGQSVAVSGDTLVVGALSEGAYVFVRNGATWSQQAQLIGSNTGIANDDFGYTVAISGDTIVVGAPFEDSNATGVNGNEADNSAISAGAAYVFVRSGTSWTQQAYLKASNTGIADVFGASVSIYGDTIVVGAYQEDSNATGVNGNQTDNTAGNSGAAYVFERSGTTWSQQAYLKASNTGAGDHFGFSVGITYDTVIVGARLEASTATGVNGDQANNSSVGEGAAYVFSRSGSSWSQQAYLKATTPGGRLFGYSVAISGDTVVVGAVDELTSGVGVTGAAHVFIRNGITWSTQAHLKASNFATSGQAFGCSVSVSGDRLVVGDYREFSNATGVNGDHSNNSAIAAGAAYVFTRSGVTWSQQAYPKASNTEGNDRFGWSVAISGDAALVGADGEDSNATGVNGNQSNNAATERGAAYIFDLDNNPSTSSYGTGTPGCAGTHTLDVTHAPMINSPHFAITCSNAPLSSLGLGLVTDTQDVPGGDPFGLGILLHSDFVFVTEVLSFDFYSDSTGYAETVGTAIPNSPALIGKTYYACALWAWSTSTCVLPGFNPYNLSTSKGLAITILVP